jgi:hypothetical protein
MKLNLTRHVIIPLSPEQCLRELQEAVDKKTIPNFWFPLIGRYQFKSNNPKRFDVLPRFWRRGPVVEGFIKSEQENSCHVYIRLMPPLWFMLIFMLAPLFLIGILQTQQEKVIFISWLFFWVLIFTANIICSFRLIKGFDKIFDSLNSEMVLVTSLSANFILRKIIIYLSVAFFYIAGLMILGTLMS